MQKVILIGLILCAAFSSAQLTLQVVAHQTHPAAAPLHTLGQKFQGLEKVLNNQRAIGYYTDKNIEHPLVIAQFEQAQYLLAPAVLDLNNTDHPFVIFDCSSAEIAIAKMKELKLIPLKANNVGIILAANPQAGAKP
jgi:hypothetical protein